MTTTSENNEENEGNEHERPKITAEDGEMLSLVINDALEGVDITRRYPTFYRRLLANAHLRQIFLDAMEALQKDEALDPLPEGASMDLSFLAPEEKATPDAQPPIEQLRVTLTRTRQQLRDLFAPPPAAVPMRSALAGMEDEYVTLLRSDVATEEGKLEVILEGRRPATADALYPVVLLILPEEVALQRSLEVTLQWGSYRETESLDQRGRASFPPLALDAILDEEGDVLTGLKLELVA